MKKKSGFRFLALYIGGFLSLSLPIQPIAVTPEFGHTPEEWERLRDNVLEYEELADLIHEYNVTVQNNKRTFRQMGTDVTYDELLGEYIGAAGDAYDMAGNAMSDLQRIPLEMQGRQAIVQASLTSAQANDSESQRWTNLNTEGLLVKEAQSTMNSYYQLQQQLTAAIKGRELLEALLASAQTRLSLNMAVQADVLTARQNLENADAQIQALQSQIESARQKLIVMTGWKQNDTPDIRPMPEVDFNRIAAMNLDRDLETALQNDYTLKINSRKAAKAGSEDVRKVYAQTSASDREQIGSTLTSAFRSVHEAKTAYDEAVLNLEVATKKLTTASNQYGLGSISLLEYRQADSEQVSAQTDLEVKRLALLQAIESYDWLVKGVR